MQRSAFFGHVIAQSFSAMTYLTLFYEKYQQQKKKLNFSNFYFAPQDSHRKMQYATAKPLHLKAP